jgi:hypothetical protein
MISEKAIEAIPFDIAPRLPIPCDSLSGVPRSLRSSPRYRLEYHGCGSQMHPSHIQSNLTGNFRRPMEIPGSHIEKSRDLGKKG